MRAGHEARPLPDDEPLAAIKDRLATLRDQTVVLTERAHEAAVHSLEARGTTKSACNHAEQAAQMRAELEVVEHELEGLRVAMNTRAVIEQAKGMLMLRQHCDADTAFAMLVSLSQTSHRKLVDVARQLIVVLPSGDDIAT